MFRVEFKQFRCWENLVIEAPIGGITLIKGSSGIGKTTILQGITWCLYGNVRLVAPNHLEKAKTRVIITFPYLLDGRQGTMKIDRQKNPNRLILSHEPEEGNVRQFEDKVAQTIIDDLFGTYDVWLASCYIGQGCRNSFLTAPNTGKMELLNSIAFHEEDPIVYIERIDAALTEKDAQYKLKLAQYNTNVEKLHTLLAGTDVNKALTPEQITSTKAEVTQTENRLTELQKNKTQRDIDLRVLLRFETQLEQAKNTMIVVPEPDEGLLSMTSKFGGSLTDDSSIIQVAEVIPLLQRRDQLAEAVRQYDNLLLPFVNLDTTKQYTQADYQEAVAQEISLRDSQRLAQSLNVLYSGEVIKETIKQKQTLLASQDQLKLEQEKQTLQMRLNLLEQEQRRTLTPIEFPDLAPITIPVPDYSKFDTSQFSEELNKLATKQGAIQNHIEHLERGKDVLKCPQCAGSLRYQQGVLVTAEAAPSDLAEINAAQTEFANLSSQVAQINQQIHSLKMAEVQERNNYDQAVLHEQRRLEQLRERVKQLELEQQRRDIAKEEREKQIIELKIELGKISEKLVEPITIPHDARLLSKPEIDQMHILIGKLASITITGAPPVSSQQIQSYLNYQDIVEKRAQAQATYEQYISTIPVVFRNESVVTLQNYVDKLRTHWNKVRSSVDEKSRLERTITSLTEQIAQLTSKITIADPTPEIEALTKRLADLRQSLEDNEKAQKVLAYHAEVVEERNEVIQLNEALSDIQVFRQHAIETECRVLQQVVDSINASIQGVCASLFDRDINISLSLFKTMKTTKNVKPIANFSISYQGGTFDNINQMSGGEGDRASLALTLALNRLSSCPLLMLDESLASLDLNMKEAAIRAINENVNNTVLVIMHDGVEGVFSHTLNIDEMSQGRY